MRRIALVLAIMIVGVSQLFGQAEIHFANGQKALVNGNYFEAISNFTKVLELEPENESALYNRGIAYLYSERFPDAIDDFTRVIEKNPKNADALNNRSLCYSYVGEIEKALEDANRAIEADPNFGEAYVNRGSIHQVMKQLEKAREDFSTAITLDPNNPASYYQRGFINYQLQNLEEAIFDFSKAIEYGINDSRLYYNRANAYFKTEQYKKAIQDYNYVISQNPDDSEALNNRAFTYLTMGDSLSARKDRERLKQINKKYFPDLETLKTKIYKSSDGKISLEWPIGWNMYERTDADNTELVITLDTLKNINDPYSTGFRLSLMENMPAQAGVSGIDGIIGFYEEMTRQAAVDYHNIRIYQQKTEKRSGLEGWRRLSDVTFQENTVPVSIYELYLTDGYNMFFGLFQASQINFTYYYKDLFEKYYETLVIKPDKMQDNR